MSSLYAGVHSHFVAIPRLQMAWRHKKLVYHQPRSYITLWDLNKWIRHIFPYPKSFFCKQVTKFWFTLFVCNDNTGLHMRLYIIHATVRYQLVGRILDIIGPQNQQGKLNLALHWLLITWQIHVRWLWWWNYHSIRVFVAEQNNRYWNTDKWGHPLLGGKLLLCDQTNWYS